MRLLRRTSSVASCTILFAIASALAVAGCSGGSAGGEGGAGATSATTSAHGGAGGSSTDLDGGAPIPATCEGYCAALHDACPDNFSTCLADCQRLEGGPCQAELAAYLACLAETFVVPTPKNASWVCITSPKYACADPQGGASPAAALAACAAQQGACDFATTTLDIISAGYCTGTASCGAKVYEVSCLYGGDSTCSLRIDGQEVLVCGAGPSAFSPPGAPEGCDLQATPCQMIFPQLP